MAGGAAGAGADPGGGGGAQAPSLDLVSLADLAVMGRKVTVKSVKNTLQAHKALPRGHHGMARGALVALLRVVLSSGSADAVTDAGVGMAATSLAAGAGVVDKNREVDTPVTCPVRKRKRTISGALSACKLVIHHDAVDRSDGGAAPSEAEICSSVETAVGPARTLAWREIILLDDRHALSGREMRPTATGVQSACNVRATGVQSGLWSMAGSMQHKNHVSHNTAPPSLVSSRSTILVCHEIFAFQEVTKKLCMS
jgi:hypothetical protein